MQSEPPQSPQFVLFAARRRKDRVKKSVILGVAILVFAVCFAIAVFDTYDENHGPCYGVWTTQWTETKGSIRESLPSLYAELNASYQSLLHDVENHRCPFGRALPGQVTLPPWNSSAVAPMNWLKGLAVVWSYFPWLLVIATVGRWLFDIYQGEHYKPEDSEAQPERCCCMCCSCCNFVPGESHRTRTFIEFKTAVDSSALLPPSTDKRRYIGTKQLYVLVWLSLAILFQEGVLKKLFMRPRPGTEMLVRNYGGKYVGSCVPTCGMPSSHSMLATGWFTILFLDRISRVETLRSRISNVESLHSLGQFLNNLTTSLDAWSSASHQPIDKYRFASHLVVWGVLLIPVPFARAELYDHTMEQAMYGSILGVLVAYLWYRFARFLQRRYRKEEGRAWLLIGMFRFYFKHDMYLTVLTASDVINGEWLLDNQRVQVEDFATTTIKRITAVDAYASIPITELTVKQVVPTNLVGAAEACDKSIFVASRCDWQCGDELHIDPDGMHDEPNRIQHIIRHNDSRIGVCYEVAMTSALKNSHAIGTKVYKAKQEVASFELNEKVRVYCGSRKQWLASDIVELLPHGSLHVDCGVFRKLIPPSQCTANTIQKALPFEVGQLVERRNLGEQWGKGYVTRLDPVKVTRQTDPRAEGYFWAEVRHELASQSKFEVKLPDHCSEKGIGDIELSVRWRTGQAMSTNFKMRPH